MRPHASAALLAQAPAGRHYCQLHRNSETLSDAVALFVATGLRRGDGVLVIATPVHWDLFRPKLDRVGVDAETCRDTGQLVLADADALVGRLMRDGMPDWPEFQRAVGGLIQSLRDRRRTAMRAYDELVNVLWRQGNPRAAIAVEDYWNELPRRHPFSLFCGYVLDGLDAGSYLGPVNDIGRTHSDVLPTADDDRLQAAVDAASADVLGLSLSLTLSFSGREQTPGEHRLPGGRRTMLWLHRNVPGSSSQILERARHYFGDTGSEESARQ